jgi:hypothetical protein
MGHRATIGHRAGRTRLRKREGQAFFCVTRSDTGEMSLSNATGAPFVDLGHLGFKWRT